MAVVRELLTRFGFDIDQASVSRANTAVNQVKQNTFGLGNSLANVALGFGAYFGVGQIVRGFKDIVKAGSDSVETLNIVNFAFGEQSKAVQDWSEKTGDKMSRSGDDMLTYASKIGAMIDPILKNKKATANMSKEVAALAVDLASFFNTTDIEALDALKSGIIGVTEPMRNRFGVVILESTLKAYALSKGITKSWKSMTEAEKVQIRFNYILSQTKTAQGDAIRTSKEYANTMKALDGAVHDLQKEIGKALLPALIGIAQGGKKLVAGFKELVKGGETVQFAFSTLLFVMKIVGAYLGLSMAAYMGKLAMTTVSLTGGLIGMGNAALVAQLKMVALGLIFLVLLAVAILLADEFYHFFKGHDTLIGFAMEEWDKWARQIADMEITPETDTFDAAMIHMARGWKWLAGEGTQAGWDLWFGQKNWLGEIELLWQDLKGADIWAEGVSNKMMAIRQSWGDLKHYVVKLWDTIKTSILNVMLDIVGGVSDQFSALKADMLKGLKSLPGASLITNLIGGANESLDLLRKGSGAGAVAGVTSVAPVVNVSPASAAAIGGSRTTSTNHVNNDIKIKIVQQPGESQQDLVSRVRDEVSSMFEDQFSSAEAANTPGVAQ